MLHSTYNIDFYIVYIYLNLYLHGIFSKHTHIYTCMHTYTCFLKNDIVNEWIKY